MFFFAFHVSWSEIPASKDQECKIAWQLEVNSMQTSRTHLFIGNGHDCGNEMAFSSKSSHRLLVSTRSRPRR
jgi:hypothetical protein